MSLIIKDMLGFYIPVVLCLTAIAAIVTCVISLLRTQSMQRKRLRMEIDKMNSENNRNDNVNEDEKKRTMKRRNTRDDGTFRITTRTTYVNPDKDPDIDEFFHAMDDAFGEANEMFSVADRMFSKSEKIFKKGR